MKLKLDENLGSRGREICEAAGHDVTTVREQQMGSADDAAIAAVCAREGRCLVTLDLDFANPLRFPPRAHAGIAVLRLPKRPSTEDLLDAVRTLVGGLARASIVGRLWIVERGRIREYQPDN